MPPMQKSPGGLLPKLAVFATDIKVAHSIFALPFAAVGLLIAGVEVPSWKQIIWLVLAMVSARTFAMGMNRVLDAEFDRKNPRTSVRAIPSGQILTSETLIFSILAGMVFVFAAFMLSHSAGLLSVPLLVILAGYSFMKRLSWVTHLYLGACLGFAPIAVSVALRESVPAAVIALGLAVMFWTAGFDILYSLQDVSFDRSAGLRSIPARFGPKNSLTISRGCFSLMVCLLLLSGYLSQAGIAWYLGVLAVSILLVWEHWLIAREGDHLSDTVIDKAFFTANAWVSVLFLLFVLIDRSGWL